MRADAIRDLNIGCQHKATAGTTGPGQDAALLSLHCSLLAEVAAQLSEMNEHLAKIANPVMTVVTQKEVRRVPADAAAVCPTV